MKNMIESKHKRQKKWDIKNTLKGANYFLLVYPQTETWGLLSIEPVGLYTLVIACKIIMYKPIMLMLIMYMVC